MFQWEHLFKTLQNLLFSGKAFVLFSETLSMSVGEVIAERVNEISFLLSLGVSAWFYRQFRRLELEQRHEELLEQLLSGK
jgi:hypothetical protein